MAKVSRLFVGNLSNGTPTEAAMREDGAMFRRFYEFNGTGKAWTKWVKMEEQYWTGEGKEHLSCGFGSYREINADGCKYRLPN